MADLMSPPQALPRIPCDDEVIPLITAIIAKYHAVRNEIVRMVNPSTASFDNVIRPLAELHNSILGDIETIYMLEDIGISKKSQAASIEARRLFLRAEAEWLARRDLFDLIKTVYEEQEDLDKESQLWLRQEFLEFTLSGHGRLDDPQLKQYQNGKARLEQQTRQYLQNLSSDVGGEWFTDDELDGVPADQISRWTLETEGPHNGQRFVPFANRGVFTVTSFAKSRETRKKMFLANERRLPKNVKLVKDITISRDAQARLLGYSSHAEFKLQKAIVKDPAWVENFLEGLSDGLVEIRKRRAQYLHDVRRQDLNADGLYSEVGGETFPPWDVAYYTRLIGLKTNNIDHKLISEYFPLERTTAAMLGIFASYMQIRFTQIPTADIDRSSVWHEDVQIWSVWDESSNTTKFLGYLYLDLLWREHKHQGFRNLNMQSVRYVKISIPFI